MRVIFMGTPDFAVPSLRALVDAGHEVVLVVSQPDRKVGRGQKLRSPPVVEAARELGLPVAQPRALRRGPFPERFLELEADVAVVVAYGRILPKNLLDGPRYGCVNVHASLLPRWRGAAPIQAALLAGDEVTGVCTQRMVEALDEGPLYLSRELPIAPDETAGTLHDRLADLGARVATETLQRLPELEPVPQSTEGVAYVGKIDRAAGEVDWSRRAVELERLVRGMTPWPGGWIPWRKGPLKLLQVGLAEAEGEPGRVVSLDPLTVACGEGALTLERVQAPGRRPVSGRDFANGARMAVGQLLTAEEVLG